MKQGDDRSKQLRAAGQYTSLGMTLAISIGGLAFLGKFLDDRWGTEPWLLLAGAMIGMVIGFVNLFRTALPPKKRN